MSKDGHIRLGSFWWQNVIKSPHGIYGFTPTRTFEVARRIKKNLMNFLMSNSFVRHLPCKVGPAGPVFHGLLPEVDMGLNAWSPLFHQEQLLQRFIALSPPPGPTKVSSGL